ncbi:hypothetical protein [uncultured Roseicyclus sp.]|nr:hypothetical protein [uncultured Roseicyclus sp.]
MIVRVPVDLCGLVIAARPGGVFLPDRPPGAVLSLDGACAAH